MSGIRNGSTDDTKQAPQRSAERIDVRQEAEVHNWSRSLGVSTAKLRVAVAAVGDRADKVEKYLEEH